MQADPQVRQEVARLALEGLATSTLEAIGGDGDAPQFLPSIGEVLNVGQPNADTIYRSASLTPGASYRLRGRRGTLNLAVIAQVVPGVGMRSHLDFAALHADKDGRYDVLLSAHPPGRLHRRLVGTDAHRQQAVPADGQLRLGQGSRIRRSRSSGSTSRWARARQSAALLESGCAHSPRRRFIACCSSTTWRSCGRKGYVNKLKVFDVSQIGGLQGQFYYEGDYDLRDDEALIVRGRCPRTASTVR